jgi:hypothetical protein
MNISITRFTNNTPIMTMGDDMNQSSIYRSSVIRDAHSQREKSADKNNDNSSDTGNNDF